MIGMVIDLSTTSGWFTAVGFMIVWGIIWYLVGESDGGNPWRR